MKKGTLIGLLILSDFVAIVLFVLAIFQRQENGDLFSSPMFYAAVGVFLLAPIVLVVIYLQNAGASDEDLLHSGLPVYATVLDVGNIRPGTKDGPTQVGMKLQINPPNGEYYEAKTTAMVSPDRPNQYYPGMMIKVRCDPKHPKRVVVDSANSAPVPAVAEPTRSSAAFSATVNDPLQQGSDSDAPDWVQDLQQASTNPAAFALDPAEMEKLPPIVRNLIQAALVDEDHNGIPDIMDKAGMSRENVVDLRGSMSSTADPQARIEKLDRLRAAGMISQEQFDMLRKMVEKRAQNQG